MSNINDKDLNKLIDRLIEIRIMVDPWLEEKKSIEDLLKEHPGEYNRPTVKVLIQEQLRKTIDWKGVREELNLTEEVLAPYRKEQTTKVIKVISK